MVDVFCLLPRLFEAFRRGRHADTSRCFFASGQCFGVSHGELSRGTHGAPWPLAIDHEANAI